MAEVPPPKVVVVGAGFAGLHAARVLGRAPVEVTVVDRNNYHTFQPLLYQLATSGLEASDIAYPVRAVFWRSRNVKFRYGAVIGADWHAGEVTLADGDRLAFDYLIIAPGATANFFGVPGAETGAFPLYTLSDARRLRDHILTCFERADRHRDDRTGALTFVVVGGGPTGVETAGALAELVDSALVHDFVDLNRGSVRIILVEMGDCVLGAFAPRARHSAAAELASRGVEVRLGEAVASVESDRVTLASGEVIATRTVVWAAGVQASHLASRLGATGGAGGRIRVERDLRLPGHDRVFAAGDVAAVPADRAERVCPQLAQVAIQSGKHAARNVVRLLDGQETLPFSYRDKGIMATVGRRAAVAQLKHGITVTGTLGWVGWLVLHLVYLIGFRNRVVVLVNWAWRYLAWRSGPRLILDPAAAGARPSGGGGDLSTG